jgi:surfactin synthase thioesterase subunit
VSGSAWLLPFSRFDDDRAVLVCLPQAGSGCGVFRGLQDELDDVATVVGVQLPGRENRFVDTPPTLFTEVVDEVVAALPVAPSILFGHSLGGLFGYEIARVLPPSALVVAAAQPPHRSGPAAGSIVHDTDEGFAETLAAKGVDEELLELAVMVLRQDADLAATYRDPAGAPVSCDLHVWGADGDDRVPAANLDEWQPYAGRGFERRQFAGGHDFCLEPAVVAPALRDLLTTVRRGV